MSHPFNDSHWTQINPDFSRYKKCAIELWTKAWNENYAMEDIVIGTGVVLAEPLRFRPQQNVWELKKEDIIQLGIKLAEICMVGAIVIRIAPRAHSFTNVKPKTSAKLVECTYVCQSVVGMVTVESGVAAFQIANRLPRIRPSRLTYDLYTRYKVVEEPWTKDTDFIDWLKARCGKRGSQRYFADNVDVERILAQQGLPMVDLPKGNVCQISEHIGISTPLIYLGTKGSVFAIHCEDFNLPSVNYMLGGDPKIWFIVSPKDRRKVENILSHPDHWPEPESFASSKKCAQYLRHQSIWPIPEFLEKAKVRIIRVEQKPHDMVITLPFALHWGYNTGSNTNVAQNGSFSNEQQRWAEQSIRKACHDGCGRWPVGTDAEYMQPNTRMREVDELGN